jgi:hypothetical protein
MIMVFDKAEANVIVKWIKTYHQICCGPSPNPVIRKRSRPEPGSFQITTDQSNYLPACQIFCVIMNPSFVNYCFEVRCKKDRRKKLYPCCRHQ